MATDRHALYSALVEAHMETGAAEKVATTIMAAIRDNVATKADIAAVNANIDARIAGVNANVEGLRSDMKVLQRDLKWLVKALAALGTFIATVVAAAVAHFLH